jgi:hypothetical protein
MITHTDKKKPTMSINNNIGINANGKRTWLLHRVLATVFAMSFGSWQIHAAELIVDDGVVVKFGTNAGIVVRDNVQTGRQSTFTSIKDDTAAGQTGITAQLPAAGDWTGLKIEASVPAVSAKLQGSTIRYSTIGLDIRKIAPTLLNLQIMDSLTGVRVSDGSAVTFTGLSLLNNTTGMEISNATPTISHSQIQGNSLLGISNLTPVTSVLATGNWWGAASGPKDTTGNPTGLGDAVSSGVSYGTWLAAAPLIDPSLNVAGNPVFTDQQIITLQLYCRNATDYRVIEGSDFTGVAFQPMIATVPFTLSAGDGTKQISVQYRNATGTIVAAALPQGIIYDTQGPALTITNPAEGSYVTSAITVSVTASDASGIARVEFYVDNQLAATDTSSPYSYFWNVPGVPDGSHSVKAIAYDAVGHSSTATRNILVAQAAPPPPDITGPVLTNLSLGGSVVTNGATFTKSGALSITVSDPSGISRVEFRLDGALLFTDTNAADGYSLYLNLLTITNGAHTLSVQGYDSLGNMSETITAITVVLASPATPTITSPVTGLLTNQTALTVSGTAEAYVQVLAYNNAVQIAGPIDVDATGKYSVPIVLTNGVNSVQVAASNYDQIMNRGGVSPLTTAVQVTVDASIPQTPLGLNAVSQTSGKIHLSWIKTLDSKVAGYNLYRSSVTFSNIIEAIKVNTTLITATTTVLDDLPTTDGTYFYRVVAVNTLGTPSDPSSEAIAVSDNTLPKATLITYAPTGKTDPATGRIAVGRVDVVVTVSEALQAAPFLSIAPTNGAPVAVNLAKFTDTEYRGSFNIVPGMPSGMAYAVFSARDVVGNRGTEVTAGASINIDAQGPILTQLSVTPTAPIRNSNATPATVTVDLTLNEAIKSAASPQLNYVLSSNLTTAIPISGLTQTGPLAWRASFTLPASAGQTAVESLSFTYSGADDLDNVATSITAANYFQVYQGNLPPLGTPLDFTAVAQPAGKIKLNWKSVTDAIGYQLYRQAPGEASASAFLRVTDPLAVEYLDTTTVDGLYRYAIASIRQANAQESLSTQSATLNVTADSVAPSAPTALALSLAGNGIHATWSVPASGAVTYNLYRANTATITSTVGLTPIKTGITLSTAVDAKPSSSDHAYVVTALDAAGNESVVSNSAYLNFSLLPVATLSVLQTDTQLPVVSWTHSNPTAVTGYDILLGPDTALEKLNVAPLQSLSYPDTGYAGDARRYTVVAFDNNGAQISRALTLPKVNAVQVAGTPLLRNVMNNVQYQVTNSGVDPISGMTMKAQIGTRETKSDVFALAVGESKLVSVVVGGYTDIPNSAVLSSTLEIVPNEGEKVAIVRNTAIAAQDSALALAVSPSNLTRGGAGQATFRLENTSDVDIEIVTAQANGNNPSTDIRYKLIDNDGNVLTTQSFKQALGANVVTLPTGQTVARIPAHAAFTSDPVDLAVPSAAPNNVTVQLDIDRIHYHLGKPETLSIQGMSSRAAASLVDTAYYGELTTVTPANSFGDQNVIITGRAVARATAQALGNATLRIVFVVNGFERQFDVATDSTGSFTYTFTPTASDGGVYKISVLHPSILERPTQGQFVINSVVVSPSAFKLSNPRNYPYTVTLHASAGEGTTATNLRVVYDAQYQPSGSLPTGITVNTGTPITLGAKQAGDLAITVTGDNSAAETGTVIFKVLADEKGTSPVASIRMDYRLTDAKPALSPIPSYVETGLAQGSSITEQLTIENRGFAAAEGVTATLINADGTPAPDWIYLPGGNTLGNLAIGEKRAIDIGINAPATLSDGIYTFKVRLAAANTTGLDIPVYVSLTQSGIGNALFKMSDIYTGTLTTGGQRIAGLTGAQITVQNEAINDVIPPITTDNLGEAYFTNLPAGRYKFRATALNHQEVIGRFAIKPGVTVTQDVFLDYNLVTVEWSVTEIVLQDRYNITLSATYETNVPAPVVLMEPLSVTLPLMKAGDIFYGELSLTNYGLVRADNVKFTPPPSDSFFRYEFLANIPTTLEAKQRVTIPYRVISLVAFGQPAGTATGGGCSNYATEARCIYGYVCANGVTTTSSAWVTFLTSSSGGSACGVGGSTGGAGIWLGYPGSGGGGSGVGNPPASLPGAQCIPKLECLSGPCCKGNGSGGGGGSGGGTPLAQ